MSRDSTKTLRRTAVVKLDISKDRYKDLKRTTEQFKAVANYVADVAWEEDDEGYKITSKTSLHERTYKECREKTQLQANHVQAARNVAAEAIKGCVEKMEEGEEVSKPRFTSDTVRYDSRTVTYEEDSCSLATVNGRVEAEYVLPEKGNNPHTEYLKRDWKKKGATLHFRDGEYYLHITVEKEEEMKQDTQNCSVLGVDVNVDGYFAVTSTGLFVESADYLNHIRQQFEQRRGKLQQVGTRSAHLTIQSIGDREQRLLDDKLHQISKEIVQEAVEHNCTEIAFEKLDHIRDDMVNLKRFHTWAFRNLMKYVEYKAEEKGIETEYVQPHYTS